MNRVPIPRDVLYIPAIINAIRPRLTMIPGLTIQSHYLTVALLLKMGGRLRVGLELVAMVGLELVVVVEVGVGVVLPRRMPHTGSHPVLNTGMCNHLPSSLPRTECDYHGNIMPYWHVTRIFPTGPMCRESADYQITSKENQYYRALLVRWIALAFEWTAYGR